MVVVDLLHEHAERSGRLGELLDLFLQSLQLLTLGLQCGDQLLVLSQGPGKIGPRLQEPLLQDLHLSGGVGQPPPEQRGLVLQEPDLRLQLLQLLSVPFRVFPWSLRHVPSSWAASIGAFHPISGRCFKLASYCLYGTSRSEA